MSFTILFCSTFEICPLEWGLGDRVVGRGQKQILPLPRLKKQEQKKWISNNFKSETERGQHKLVNRVMCHNYIVYTGKQSTLGLKDNPFKELSGFNKLSFQITSLIFQYTNYVLITLYFSLKRVSWFIILSLLVSVSFSGF